MCVTRARRFSGKWKSYRGVLSVGLVLHVLIVAPEPPWPGRETRNMLGWSLLWRKQKGLGYGCSGVPSKGRIFSLPLSQQETGSGKGRTTQRGRSLVMWPMLVGAVDWVRKGIVPHSVVGPLWFPVHLFVCVLAGPSCRATYWRAVLATAGRCVEGYRTPDEALVC